MTRERLLRIAPGRLHRLRRLGSGGHSPLSTSLRKILVNNFGTSFSSGQLVFGAPAGRGDLADYVIREHARAAGADTALTFDKALLKDTVFAAP